MAKLTDADRRAFAHQVVEVLRLHAPQLSAAGFDVTTRLTQLEASAHEADVKEAAQLSAQQAALRATQESTTATDDAYDFASKSVSLVEGILGKDDPLVTVLRGLRPALHNAPSPAPKP
ncbi:hypothetical protein [Armatimonas sp.]|uniref:hypothetical protein n=1 Tax=Armatimonas sp. TaxID=1872638 RepID=UPI00286BCBA3|nr:hypothetical protein [Armatimonas sp.]